MKALVTGGAGFIGANLVFTLEKKGTKVVVLDDFSSGDYKNLVGFKGDVVAESVEEVNLKGFKDVDVIFHQAAITDTTIRNQKLMMQVNVEGFRRLLEFAVRLGIPFIYASSAGTYGNIPGPQREEMAGHPANIYGFSKWICDNIAREYMQKTDTLIIGLRYFNVFGPKEAHKGKMASMIWQLANQMKDYQRPRIFKWGEQKRDQVYVKDVVQANLLALKAKRNAIVNIGSGQATTFNEIIRVLNKVLGTELEPEYIDNPYVGFYQDYTQADLTLAQKIIGYSPQWGFEEAVKDYMKEVGFIEN